MNTDRVANLAARWLTADEERRLRRQERGHAMVLARKGGVERAFDPERDCFCWPGNLTESQRELVTMCQRAQKAYITAAAKANGLRSALRKAAKPALVKVEPDEEISGLYRDLCDEEMEASRAEEASYWSAAQRFG